MAEQNPEAGLIVVDSAGAVVYTSGLASEPAIVSLVTSPDSAKSLKQRRLSALTLNGQQLYLLAVETTDALAVFVSPVQHDALFSFISSVDFASDIFGYLVSNPFDAMTVVDAESRLRYISPVHAEFFGLAPGEGTGKKVDRVIENTRLHHVVKTGRAEIGVLQRMQGTSRIVSRVPILRDEKIVGAVGRVMFKGPKDVETLNRRVNDLEREVAFYRDKAENVETQDVGIDDVVGEAPAMKKLASDVRRVAPLDVPVLIQGESGVGKELIARALHHLSPRHEKPLVTINAAALPDSLVESELFGYASGAFTGASAKGRTGKFEQAHGGTLFLDEIGEMPVDVQAKLLRILQDGLVERLGSEEPVNVDFRLVSATNRPLDDMVEAGAFRLDLFYRISPVVLRVPPLRERLSDVDALVRRFLDDFTRKYDSGPYDIEPEAIALIKAQPWPGNIRQLKHEIERAAIFCDDGMIKASGFEFAASPGVDAIEQEIDAGAGGLRAGERLQDMLTRMEDEAIQEAMLRLHGNKKRVAEELSISRSYLYKKLAQLGMV
jgi:transcriptional regulator with PAS, ATPase and Fis domain